MTHTHKHFLSFKLAILLNLMLVTACSYQENKTPTTVSTLTETVSFILNSTPTPTATFPPTPPPTLLQTPSPTPTTTAGVLPNITEKELDAYLRRKLSLSSDFDLHFERGFGDVPEEEELIAFYVDSSYSMPRRGIIRNMNGMVQVELYEEDPCYCLEMSSIGQKHLVPSSPPFLIVEYSPLTGTCVGVDVFEILIIKEGDYFKQALKIFTYGDHEVSSDNESTWIAGISNINYSDINGDSNLEIIENVKIINCGDECLCREGPIEEEFQNIFIWDESTETFVEQVAE